MKLLIVCRRAKELARRILHGWYEKEMTAEDILAAAGGRLAWIGAGGEGLTTPGASVRAMQRVQDSLPALAVEDESWHFQSLGEGACLLFGRFRLISAPETGLSFAEQQRATLLLSVADDGLRLLHVHISSPVSRRRRSLYSFDAPESRRDYLGELAARRLEAAVPELTKRQRKVLSFLLEGLPYKEIADVMNITPRTVRYYVTEIERRLGVENRTLLIDAVLKRELGGGGGELL